MPTFKARKTVIVFAIAYAVLALVVWGACAAVTYEGLALIF